MSQLVITNKSYLDRPDQYRAANRLPGDLDSRLGIDFRPQGVPVPEFVVMQLRNNIERILAADTATVYAGDGGLALILAGLKELQSEFADLAHKAIAIAPGGTMNNLHSSLRKYGNISAETAKPTRIREFSWTHDGYTERSPVVSFFGIGAEAQFLHYYEQKSRRNRRELNIASAGVDMAADFWEHRKLAQASHAVLAIPVWGIMQFPKEFYRLSEEDMALMDLSARNGFEAAGLFALYQLAGQSPDFLRWLWRRQGLRHAIAREVPPLDWFITRAQDMKPKIVSSKEFKVEVNGNGFIYHTDGTAHLRKVSKGATVHCSIATKPGSSVLIYAA